MLTVETEKNELEIVDAINLISKKISETVSKSNQFAASIMLVDDSEVEDILNENKALLDANRTLLEFSCDLLGEDPDELAKEFTDLS